MAVARVGLTTNDLDQLERYGISADEATRQLALLRTAPPAVVLDRPCTVGDGIVQLSPADRDPLLAAAQAAIAHDRVIKFVPASGAASRMFKDLVAALESDRPSASEAARTFFERLDDFPFAAELRSRAQLSGAPASSDEQRRVLRILLREMRYADLPKALIPFHRTPIVRTAFEEHLLEATQYAAGSDGHARAHFTVAPEWRGEFDAVLSAVARRVEAVRAGSRLVVSFSEQHPATDTLAATPQGEPFRLSDGTLLLRPAGHGALLRNLQELGGDLVVIKNIDNVLPFEANAEVVQWKRLLIGYTATVQQDAFAHVQACGPDAGDEVLDAAIAFLAARFGRSPDRRLDDVRAKRAFVQEALHRPLRVCGVVRNEGEPGGAPFWIVDRDGRLTAQIVEGSQIDLKNPAQRRVFESSTHFNPVDLVCAVRGADGTPFDLDAFVDREAVFLAKKSHEGRELIALERPGLWNGAMAHWNTIFVEVPAATFAPVKTVLDLLRPQHQSL